ncbi:MAG: DUF2231 domain-containing protein [Proteobacteria bacterium]|nr:DUF2231 domain-containing protein [Pseudomonadota bacterium]
MTARHPLHPAIVHFPIACWTLAAATDFASLSLGELAWRWSAGLLAVGCGMALLAMATGLVELSRIPEGPALRDTWLHMCCMLTASGSFATRLLSRLGHMRPLPPDGWSLSLDVCGLIALIVGGWLGGRLVYGHGLGRI